MADGEELQNSSDIEGTDVDQVLKKAQEERQRIQDEQKKADDDRRVEAWYGVKPGEVPSDEALVAMQDHQRAMEQQLANSTEKDATEKDALGQTYVEKDSTLSQEQQLQANDLEYLKTLFAENSDKEHHAEAWKLFDEFVDKYNVDREKERVLRDQLIHDSQEKPTQEEVYVDDSVPTSEGEGSDGDNPMPDIHDSGGSPVAETVTSDTNTPEQPPAPDSNLRDDGLKIPGGLDWGGRDDRNPTDETPSTENPQPFSWDGPAYTPPGPSETSESNGDGQPTVEMPPADVAVESTDVNVDPEKGAPIAFGGIEGSDLSDSEYPVESTGEAIDFKSTSESEPEAESDEDKEKKSIWEHAKQIPFALQSKIDAFFNDGTEEQNRTKKLLAAAMGATVAALAVKYGISHLTNEGANAVNSGSGGITPDALHPAALSSHGGGTSGTPEVAGHATETIEKIRHGETIWGHVKEALMKHDGKEPSNWKIFKETAKTLRENGLTWAKARLLADNTEIKLMIR